MGVAFSYDGGTPVPSRRGPHPGVAFYTQRRRSPHPSPPLPTKSVTRTLPPHRVESEARSNPQLCPPASNRTWPALTVDRRIGRPGTGGTCNSSQGHPFDGITRTCTPREAIALHSFRIRPYETSDSRVGPGHQIDDYKSSGLLRFVTCAGNHVSQSAPAVLSHNPTRERCPRRPSTTLHGQQRPRGLD